MYPRGLLLWLGCCCCSCCQVAVPRCVPEEPSSKGVTCQHSTACQGQATAQHSTAWQGQALLIALHDACVNTHSTAWQGQARIYKALSLLIKRSPHKHNSHCSRCSPLPSHASKREYSFTLVFLLVTLLPWYSTCSCSGSCLPACMVLC